MGFRDKDGEPLLKFDHPEQAWDHSRALSEDQPCDQSALTYDKLRATDGIQWPVTDDAPDGTERLYADGQFGTGVDKCESYGHDLITGATNEKDEYAAHDPDGRAMLKAAEYSEPNEWPDEDYPFLLTTGRSVYHFHTRTKTGRSAELRAAAPSMWVELSTADAARLELQEGDMVRVESRRGHIEAPVLINGSRDGLVFAPFHFGSWDHPDGAEPTAANELTITEWDPVSKQPLFKVAAVRVTKR
jgi:anaerobic selenocysteine-containing dehydrogenase